MCLCVCVCVCVCVVSVIVKRPVLPPYVVDGCSRNPLYYYYRPTPASPASDQFPDSFRISSSDHGRSHERGPFACPPSLPPTAVAAAPLS